MPRPPSTADVTRETARHVHRGMMVALGKDPNECPKFSDLQAQAAGVIARAVPLRDAWGRELRGYCDGEAKVLVRSAGPDA